MGIIQSLKCKLGDHDWGAWEFQTRFKDSECTQARVCRACGRRESTQLGRHTWGGWSWSAADSCQQERSCTRCGQRDTLTMHAWQKVVDPPVPPYRMQKILSARCQRCGRISYDELVLSQFQEDPHQQDLRDEWGMN